MSDMFYDDTRVHKILFGPGSLEMVRLDLWVSRSELDAKRFEARIVGNYDVFCPHGMHRVDVHEREAVWSTEKGLLTRDIIDAYFGDTEAGRRLATFLVNEGTLGDWFDPCEAESVAVA